MAENQQASQEGDPSNVDNNPLKVVDQSIENKTKPKRAKSAAVERPYPRQTIERAITIPKAIKSHNGGNPWIPQEVAKAINLGMSAPFYYITAASRDFGFTEGTRDAASISITDLGKRAVYPSSAEEERQALLDGFLKIDVFRRVIEHYHGSRLPEKQFLHNTLQTTFGLDPRVHEEFIDLFQKNCRFLGIGADFDPSTPQLPARSQKDTQESKNQTDTIVAHANNGNGRICFVIMPFTERSDAYATGFFQEVFDSVFKPAITAAGFTAMTAKRQGSDVIQSTIVTQLLKADIVLADLTDHNPNVLFELGVRLAKDLPTALVRAQGTGAIFDVDNMLRVESYNPNLWPSTVKNDIPKLTAHIQAAWENRETDKTFMKLLG